MKSKIANGYDLLNKKREREIYYNKLYNNGNDLEEEKINYENGKYNNIGYYKNNGNENEQNKKIFTDRNTEFNYKNEEKRAYYFKYI